MLWAQIVPASEGYICLTLDFRPSPLTSRFKLWNVLLYEPYYVNLRRSIPDISQQKVNSKISCLDFFCSDATVKPNHRFCFQIIPQFEVYGWYRTILLYVYSMFTAALAGLKTVQSPFTYSKCFSAWWPLKSARLCCIALQLSLTVWRLFSVVGSSGCTGCTCDATIIEVFLIT